MHVSSALVPWVFCLFILKVTKQLLVLKQVKEGRKEQRFSVRVSTTPPSDLNMDSPDPPGSTTWTDPTARSVGGFPPK